MKSVCFYAVCLSLLWACEKKSTVDQLPQAYKLEVVDSIEIVERNGYLSKPSNVKLINDTLLGIESFHSKGVWVFNSKTGEEVSSILDGREKGLNFRSARVFWDEFPIVYVLDGMTKRIHQFDLSSSAKEDEKHMTSISLILPDGISIKPLMVNFFYKKDDRFLIEQYTNKVRLSSNQFYKLTDKLVGSYDLQGNYMASFYDFPTELKKLEKFVSPGTLYSSGMNADGTFFLSFPFTGKLESVSIDDISDEANFIPLPASRHFIFELPLLEQEVSNGIGIRRDDPIPHYFGDIFKENDNIIFQTFMRSHEFPADSPILTHLLGYDYKRMTWKETTPELLADFGLLAGSLNDTLYIVEAGLINTDHKYIKRAILLPATE